MGLDVRTEPILNSLPRLTTEWELATENLETFRLPRLLTRRRLLSTEHLTTDKICQRLKVPSRRRLRRPTSTPSWQRQRSKRETKVSRREPGLRQSNPTPRPSDAIQRTPKFTQ